MAFAQGQTVERDNPIIALTQRMERDECNQRIGKEGTNAEYNALAAALMAWHAQTAQALDMTAAQRERMLESLYVLGTIMQYAFCLGHRQGERKE